MSHNTSPIRAIVVDDEPLARERVVSLLSDYPTVTLVAQCATGSEAVDAIRGLRPDLLFLDIQMPELSGFDVLATLAEDDLPAIVFITAHDEHAIQAFDVNAVDYVLKPIEESRFRTAVDRALTRLGRDGDDGPRLRRFAESVRSGIAPLERIAVRARGRYTFVATDTIDWIEGAGNYVVLHAGGRDHVVRGTLNSLEARLGSQGFLRVHRSAIVNAKRIESVEPAGHGEFVLVVAGNERIGTSRSYSRAVRSLVD